MKVLSFNIKKIKLSICLFFFIFTSNVFFGKGIIPYKIDGEFVMEDSLDYKVAGFDFIFNNNENKNVKEFTVVFYLFNEDGDPASNVRNNIVMKVEKNVPAKDYLAVCLSLDKYVYTVLEEKLFVDYLYVSKIVYEDGSVWTDPFGLSAF